MLSVCPLIGQHTLISFGSNPFFIISPQSPTSPIHIHIVRPTEQIVNGYIKVVREPGESERVHTAHIVDSAHYIDAQVTLRKYILQGNTALLAQQFYSRFKNFSIIHKTPRKILCKPTKSPKYVII
jgi:hypothetical protein